MRQRGHGGRRPDIRVNGLKWKGGESGGLSEEKEQGKGKDNSNDIFHD